MKKIKIIVFSVFMLILAGCIVKAIHLNVTFPHIPVKTYSMNETVEYEKDYYLQSDADLHNREGISIHINSAELLTLSEYAEKHGISQEDLDNNYQDFFRPKYVFDLNATISADSTIWKDPNADDVYAGIPFYETVLVTKSMKFALDGPLMTMAYPDNVSGFDLCVEPNTSENVSLAFPTYELIDKKGDNYVRNLIKTKDFYFLVSQYPTKKMIRIDFEG